MHVRKIILHEFMRHAHTVLELPESGIVTVVGPNGSGKSSIAESVAYGIFGKTLRGTDPWPGPDGWVSVETGVVSAHRERRKSKVSLSWHHPAALDSEDYATLTKAQEGLDAFLGMDFDVWRRVSVFSSADAANFTLATDGERKRLLEALLDISKFDDALSACRDRLRSSTMQHAEAQQRLALAQERMASAERAVASARNVREAGSVGLSPEDEAKARKDLVRVVAGITEGVRLIGLLWQASRTTDADAVNAKAELRQARAKHDLLRGGVCPTCAQPIGSDLATSLEAAVAAASARAATLEDSAIDVVRSREAELAELEAEQETLRRRQTALQATLRSAEDGRKRQAAIERETAAASVAMQKAQKDLEAAQQDVGSSGKDLPLLRACEVVLGLRGVRAQLLGRALSGLETAANLYLRRIAGDGLRLALKPFVEKKTGGISDAIGLEIVGAGNGNGYRGASGGERRRIDVALLLALAETAASARGSTPGTLFFDEVFDSLDEDGVDAVVEVLEGLSTSRAIVVITHSPTLAARLPGRRISVLDGAVVVG